ncbi:phosphonate C-P lyase system protein PhnH [Mesorhizobium xinjiangense]|uniref:phosphonate C-P lyase system protein PhnH n=1 Tax=Mesorhizobium xinjiangense TaxID=2678685 RepID=UPI0012EDD4A7|nr:phosphonate C-P lyase system protein PhnH [Mesorhizobium xinjiangense]
METAANAVEGGFDDAVLAGQAAFRAQMDAMARPGTVQPVAPLTAPPGLLSAVAGSVALTLCDQDTPLWLDPRMQADGDVKAWLAFHCGAPLAHTPADAHFALVSSPGELIALENFAQGSQDYPDRSTTLILQVESLTGGEELALEGPGIKDRHTIAPKPMPRHFLAQWTQNNARFPRGVDLVLAGDDAVVCLPRTTRISRLES